ncbi:MAG: hypothetical protein AB7K24_06070 [Gemmataceae bacterium]
MNEQNQNQQETKKVEQTQGPAGAEELKEEQLERVAGGGHVKVFSGQTGQEIR